MPCLLPRLLLVLLAALAAAPLVRADDGPGLANMGASDMSDERARAHFKAGTSLYESGRFPEAAEEWEKAYALSQRETLLYNIYVAHRDASDLAKAIDALQRYLATHDPDAAQRLNLDARLRSMQAALAAQEQKRASDAPAQPAEPTAATPPPGTASSDSSDSSGAGAGLPVLPLALVITGGALVTGGLVTGLLTQSKVSEIEGDCPRDVCPSGYDLDTPRDSARTLATLTDVLLASGAVISGVGIVLWLTSDGAPNEAPAAGASARLMPRFACSTDGCVAVVRGRL
jgi:tetratricopeptide (TPR) repeat protein